MARQTSGDDSKTLLESVLAAAPNSSSSKPMALSATSKALRCDSSIPNRINGGSIGPIAETASSAYRRLANSEMEWASSMIRRTSMAVLSCFALSGRKWIPLRHTSNNRSRPMAEGPGKRTGLPTRPHEFSREIRAARGGFPCPGATQRSRLRQRSA